MMWTPDNPIPFIGARNFLDNQPNRDVRSMVGEAPKPNALLSRVPGYNHGRILPRELHKNDIVPRFLRNGIRNISMCDSTQYPICAATYNIQILISRFIDVRTNARNTGHVRWHQSSIMKRYQVIDFVQIFGFMRVFHQFPDSGKDAA